MFKPKCAPFYIDDQGNYHQNEKPNKPLRGPAISYGNWMLPCIWCQNKRYRDELHERFNMLSEHLKLPNVKDVDEIINSDEWRNFRKQLFSGVDLPKVCEERCTTKK